SRYRTLRLAHERPRLFFDAHNLVVEYLVTTGVVGGLLFVAWAGFALHAAGWQTALGGFAVLVLAVHLVEPQNAGLTPLAFLALGAAGAVERGVVARGVSAVHVLAVPLALALAAVMLVGSWDFRQAALRRDLAASRFARDWLPPWPETALGTAHI